MTAATAPEPLDFRLNTAADIAQLSNETLAAHMAEMEEDRVGNAGTDDWYLRPVHEAWDLYNAEATQRRDADDTFWPEGRKYVPLEDGNELPF